MTLTIPESNRSRLSRLVYRRGNRIQIRQNTFDLAAERVLYIGTPKHPDRLDFPSTERVSYIGAQPPAPSVTPTTCRVVGRHIFGVGSPVTAQIPRVLLQPPAGIRVKTSIDIRIGPAPALLGLIVPGFLADLPGTGFLFRDPRIRHKLPAAEQTSLGRRHSNTST